MTIYPTQVLVFMMALKSVLDPTTEDALRFNRDEHHAAIQACQAAVAERQFTTAFQQAGAELPSLRTVQKFCAKHIDALSTAWELCPELEVLCVGLHSALQQEVTAVNGSIIANADVSRLSREEAVPEYMHLLRSVVEEVAAYLRPQSSQRERADISEAYRRTLSERQADLASLYRLHPELSLAAVSSEAPYASCSSPEQKSFLVQAYGAGTALLQEKHHALLTASLTVFDAQCEKNPFPREQGSMTVEQDLATRFTASPSSVQLAAFVDRFFEGAYDVCIAAAKDLSKNTAKPPECTNQHLAELLLPEETVVGFLRTQYAAHTDKIMLQVSEIDPSISAAAAAECIENAYIQYLERNLQYLPVLDGLLKAGEGELWIKCFGQKDETSNFPTELVSCATQLQKAQTMLLIARYVQDVKQYLQSDEQALADFAEALPARPYPDKSAKEFADLWELHSALHGYLWGNNSSLSQVKGVEPVSEASENCRFYAKVEYFLFEAAKQPPFDDAFVACNMLKSIYSILEAGNRECYTQYLALQTSMHAWSAQFPITCGADKTDFTERYEATVDDEVTHKLALRVAFANRSLSILMLEGFKRMVKAEDVTIQQEILRAVSYLSDPRHDPSSLLSLVKKRIEDMGLRSTLISGMLKSPETQESLKKVNDKWKSRSDLVAKLKMFYAKVKSNDIWSEEHLHIQTFFEGVEGGLKDIILNAKKGLLDTFKKCVWRDQTWQAVGADLENILSQARAEAAAWKNRHSESIEGLRAGSLPSALREITLLAKGGIKVHTSLLDATSGARKARVLQAAEATSSRLDKYMQLMQLRAVHAPPWHFGYGQRVANSKLSANNSVSPQQLKPEAWKSDWQEFTRKDYSGVCFMCPAEHEVEKSVVQVADSSEVLISCTDAGLPWAEIILKCLTEMDERMQISLLPSKPAHKVGVGSWVYFQSELYMDSGDSPQVGLLVEYTSHFFKGVCLHFDKTFSTMRPVDFDSCQVMPDYVRWLGKIKALELMHAPVSVNCDGKLRRGLTVYRRPTGRDAMISVHLDGDEAPSLYPLEYVEPLIPLARHHKKAWQQGFQFMVGMRVKVGTKAAMRDGSVCDEQVEVRFDDDGTIGVFPIHLVEPIDAERKAALATGKAVICCIDSSFNSELLCVDEVADAENLGLGIIPVLLPGYKIHNYQEWWPQELSALKCHSLFIDMRSVGLDTAGTSTIRDICTENISPTLRVVLSEQKDRNAVTALATSPVAPPADPATTSRTADNGVGSQYVYCELCTVEKVYLDSTSGTSADRCNSKPATGSFDRWRCQQLVAEWTAQELQRREQHPDQPSVMMCPVSVHCSGAETHEKLARDVLAIKEKRTSYPCPSCMTKGILPPYCFDRELCLAELEYNSGGGGFVTCKRCHQPTALHELLVCEVFLSYCWGSPQCPKCTAGLSVFEQRELKRNGLCEPCGGTYPGNSWKYSTQRLVSELKGAIEPEAGVMCWQDVDRLVGGKDLEREMEMGVKQADVIVIFLDDGYVKSFNCRREYLHATKHGKYIIPILLSGYTGGSGNVDPERWWPESMSSLAQFQPIYLTEGSQMENVLFEVCERIQSRFHRAQRFPTADDAIAYLRDYSSWGVTRKAFLADNMSLDRREEVEAHLQDAFVKMDRDGNNLVDEAELTAFLDENNICLSREQISTLIMEADVDHNGCLSLEELKQAVFAILEEQAREGTVA